MSAPRFEEGSATSRGLSCGVLVLVVLHIVSGAFALRHWSPTEEGAVNFHAIARVPGDPWWVATHYWSGHIALFTLLVMVMASIWSVEFRASALRWYGTLLMLGGSLMAQVTGNALPMDRHDIHTIGVESAVAARIPLLGSWIRDQVLAGESVTYGSVLRWYEAHTFIAAPLIIVGALLSAYGLLRDRPQRPQAEFRVLAFAPLAVVILFASLVEPATGTIAGPDDFGRQSAAPSWYVLPMHASLRFMDLIHPAVGWIGATLGPAVIGLVILLAPRWTKNMPDGRRRGIVAISVFALIVFSFAFGGRPAPISGPQNVLGEARFEGKVASVDAALASKGKTHFEKRCAGCHGSGGIGSGVAPSLLHIWKRHPDAGWYIRFIRNPQSVKPGSTMPAIGAKMSDAELAAVAEWLRSEK